MQEKLTAKASAFFPVCKVAGRLCACESRPAGATPDEGSGVEGAGNQPGAAAGEGERSAVFVVGRKMVFRVFTGGLICMIRNRIAWFWLSWRGLSGAFHLEMGSCTVKVVPSSGEEVKVRSPPWARATRRAL